MIICELGFKEPDAKRPEYSIREVDYYGFVPFDSQRKFGIESHRLSLRKNLKTGLFEVYRYYPRTRKEEVVFAGKFEDALKFADGQWNKYWGHLGKKEPDKPCTHRYPFIDIFCPKIKQL